MPKKLVVILGPTASGKSRLAIKLAKKFKGEVVSADSRQVYKGMDIGTGKITKKEMRGVPHHLLDVASPRSRFTVAQYRKLTLKAIEKIIKKRNIPIICGGTAFYIQAVVDGIVIPVVPPDWQLRKRLEKKSAPELYQILKKLDPKRAKTIEKENPRRLIRAIEIIKKTKKPVPVLKTSPLPYPILMIGLKTSKKQLPKRIEKRVEKMFRQGLEKEAKKFPREIIGYQEWQDYFKGKINKKMVKDLIKTHTLQYAKRQMTWFTRQNFAPPVRPRVAKNKSGRQNLGGFKKDKRIHWIKNYQEAENLTRVFLKQ